MSLLLILKSELQFRNRLTGCLVYLGVQFSYYLLVSCAVSEYYGLLAVAFFDSGFVEYFQYFFIPCIDDVWEKEAFLVPGVSKCNTDLLRNLVF